MRHCIYLSKLLDLKVPNNISKSSAPTWGAEDFKIAQASTFVLGGPSEDAWTIILFLKSAVIFSNVFSISKTLSKSTALLLIKTPHKSSFPILLQYVVKRQVTRVVVAWFKTTDTLWAMQFFCKTFLDELLFLA